MYMEYPHRVISLALSHKDNFNKPFPSEVTCKVSLHSLISNQSLNLLAALSPAKSIFQVEVS